LGPSNPQLVAAPCRNLKHFKKFILGKSCLRKSRSLGKSRFPHCGEWSFWGKVIWGTVIWGKVFWGKVFWGKVFWGKVVWGMVVWRTDIVPEKVPNEADPIDKIASFLCSRGCKKREQQKNTFL
jgi:hypothetical protein